MMSGNTETPVIFNDNNNNNNNNNNDNDNNNNNNNNNMQTLKYCYQNNVLVGQLFVSNVYLAALLLVCKVVLDVCFQVNEHVLHVYISQRKFTVK